VNNKLTEDEASYFVNALEYNNTLYSLSLRRLIKNLIGPFGDNKMFGEVIKLVNQNKAGIK